MEVDKISEKNLAIRVDEEFVKKVKIRIAEKGMTLKDYFVDLVEKDILDSELDKATHYTKDEIIEKADQIIQLMKEIKESQK